MGRLPLVLPTHRIWLTEYCLWGETLAQTVTQINFVRKAKPLCYQHRGSSVKLDRVLGFAASSSALLFYAFSGPVWSRRTWKPLSHEAGSPALFCHHSCCGKSSRPARRCCTRFFAITPLIKITAGLPIGFWPRSWATAFQASKTGWKNPPRYQSSTYVLLRPRTGAASCLRRPGQEGDKL